MSFNWEIYMELNPDLVKIGLRTKQQYERHYMMYGKREGRKCNILQLYQDFSHNCYRDNYEDLKGMDNIQLELHWLRYGKSEGRCCDVSIGEPVKIVIYTYEFNINSGGIVVLHYLAKLLNDRNINTKLYLHNNCKSINNMFCNKYATIGDITDETIVIYPELIEGNPLCAKKVIRWILLEMDKTDDRKNIPNTWGPDDLVYHWETKENTKQLCCPWFNPIFTNRNKNGPRNNTCYLIKKGRLIHKSINYFHPTNSICIDGIDNLERLSNIFNSCEYFYCYDPNCAFSIFAAACGCIPIVYPISGVSNDEFFKNRMFNYKGEIFNKGIVYGNDLEGLEKAKSEINNLDGYYQNLFNMYLESVDELVRDIDIIDTLNNKVKNEYMCL